MAYVDSRGKNSKPRTLMKPPPSTTTALRTEAMSLGLLGPNPNLKEPRAKLLNFVNNSKKIGRSFNHASILVVGSSGVGKSSSINHLLNTGSKIAFAKTNEAKSETRTTQEYIIYADAPEYEVADLPLGVVDSPGFNDTDGYKQDACNFFSIKTFYETHPKLLGCYPNLVFLFVQATDTRVQGANSNLSKSLRCLKRLGIVDPNKPNIVAVLSFCCSISYRNVQTWSEKMETRKSIIQEVIFDTLKVTAPVVLLENDYDKDGYDLDVRGDYTSLPNGVLQPKNLYDACADVLKKSKDHLGLIILNSVFKASRKKPPQIGHKTEAKDASKCKLNHEEEEFVDFFAKAAKGGVKDPICDATQQYIQKENLRSDEQQEVRELALTLKRMGVQDPQDCKSITEGSVKYFHGENISPMGANMLRQEFQIEKKPVEIGNNSDSGRLVGQGFNILTDKTVPTQIMKFDVGPTEYGIVIPKCAKFEKVEQTRSFMDQFEDDKSYTKSRLASLNVSLDVEYKMFNMSARAGWNKSSETTSSSSQKEYSYLFEQRMFELKIGNYKEYLNNGMTFTSDFESAVADLPTTYNKNDPSCRSIFERFFNRFGHFLVSSAYGGGSIETKVTRETVGSGSMSFEETKACLSASFDGLVLDVKGEVSGSDASSTAVKSKALLSQSTQCWQGGERSLHAKETVADREKMQKWQASLLVKPTMLVTEMSLEPISTVVACVDAKRDQPTYDALKDLLGGEFKLVADREKAREEENRIRMEEERRRAEAEATTRAETVQQPSNDSGGCFPSSSIVNVRGKDGIVKQQKMADLQVGNEVLAWDEKQHRTIFSEVIMFGHRESIAVDVAYLKITLDDGNIITLSDNHLVMVSEHKKAVMAKHVKNGDILFAVNENQQLSSTKVLAVDKVTEAGIYCPITTHGNLIVNNILASCYPSVQDHVFFKGLVKASAQNIAHLGLMPMRVLHRLRSKWVGEIPKGQTIHPYLQWLCKLNLPFMASFQE